MSRSSGRVLTLVLVLFVLLASAAVGGYYWLQQQFFAPDPRRRRFVFRSIRVPLSAAFSHNSRGRTC